MSVRSCTGGWRGGRRGVQPHQLPASRSPAAHAASHQPSPRAGRSPRQLRPATSLASLTSWAACARPRRGRCEGGAAALGCREPCGVQRRPGTMPGVTGGRKGGLLPHPHSAASRPHTPGLRATAPSLQWWLGGQQASAHLRPLASRHASHRRLAAAAMCCRCASENGARRRWLLPGSPAGSSSAGSSSAGGV